MAQLSDAVVLRSPVAFEPYEGAGTVGPILQAVERVLEDFRFIREIGAPEASDHALVFRARVGDKQIEGCDFVHTDASGKVDELMVMVRPLSAAIAFAEAMKAQLASDPAGP